ncbi:hypothetical protein L5M11_13080 [Shewanella sp. SM87]|uniref:hypothetical protein n=1 Tax=Shewanella sp. SM87 TaxID=2912808 RepID=UPI0021DA33A1|nr:hypothetical protein [Shewanella sp. SM87]MCU8008448.1 hypothetical protein [Shewanella sp. SM87]
MSRLQGYLNTSADDAKMSLQYLLKRDPQEALSMANQIIAATASLSNKKTLHKTAVTIKKKAEKAIKESV